MRPRPVLLSLTLTAALLAACQQPPLACGVYPDGGGPAMIRTRDHQLCELVRLRVLQHMARAPDLTFQGAEALNEAAQGWARADDLEELVALVRRDAGDDLASLIVRAVTSIDGPAGKPLPTDCADVQQCLVDGAVKGAQLALAQRHYYVSGGRPEGDTVPAGTRGGIDIEDLSD